MTKLNENSKNKQNKSSGFKQWKQGFFEELKPRIKEFKYSLHLVRKSPLTMAGIIIILSFVIIAILAPYIAPYDPERLDLPNQFQKPSREHLFGTDDMGRDIFSRILYGARIDLTIGIIVVFASFAIGVSLGVIAGYMGGRIDEIIMRITDIFLAFPGLVLVFVIAYALRDGVWIIDNVLYIVMASLIIVWWPGFTRITRGQALSVRENEYVEAARAVGASNFRIIFKHVLPNCLSPVIVRATMEFGVAILVVAALGFLGVGAESGTPEWGAMIAEGRDYIDPDLYPWIPTFPGLAILIVVLGFNFIGDGLRDILDPRIRR